MLIHDRSGRTEAQERLGTCSGLHKLLTGGWTDSEGLPAGPALLCKSLGLVPLPHAQPALSAQACNPWLRVRGRN